MFPSLVQQHLSTVTSLLSLSNPLCGKFKYYPFSTFQQIFYKTYKWIKAVNTFTSMSAEHMDQHCRDQIFARHNVGHSFMSRTKAPGLEELLKYIQLLIYC